jgi:hypothetical protein
MVSQNTASHLPLGRMGRGQEAAPALGEVGAGERGGAFGAAFLWGLAVGYLPRYSPHLNPVETVWRRVKGFLMPRRRYGSVEELRRAVAVAMERLREEMGQEVLQSLWVNT